eukprot:gene28046-biopygen31998
MEATHELSLPYTPQQNGTAERSVLDNPLFEQGELVTLHGPNSLSVGHASGDLASRDNSRGGTTRSESVSSLESVATGHDVPGWGQPTGLGLTGSSLVQTSLGSRAALLTPGEGLSQVPSPNSDGELAPEPVTPVTGSYDADNPDRDAWIIASKDEMAFIATHGTWILTPASRVKQKILPNMWIFTIKNGLDGQPERHKARLVIKGFHQRPGLEFDAVLVKSLYGLKQAPRMWCREVRKVLVKEGYRSSRADPALFVKQELDGSWSYVAREVQWIKQLRNDLGLPCTLVTIQCDSQGALSWTGDWKLEPKAKHIDIIHHYIKCLVEDKRLAVTYVNTKDNKADPFTKPLTPALFWEFMKLHGMVSLAKA